MIRWGIDLGGTKIEGVVLNDVDGEVLARTRIPTEGNQGYHHVLRQIDRLVSMLMMKTGLSPQKIGVGTPGSIYPPTGLLKNSNSQHLNGKPFQTDLQNLMGVEITTANDANCFALAETHVGLIQHEIQAAKIVFGVIMGTGVGGGLVINGEIINGANGIGGEWGHNFLDKSGGKCYCGKIGCVETVISGPALEKYYQSLCGKSKSLQQISSSVTSDKYAKQTIDRLIQFFGIGLSNIINMIDPDVIILGGGVGNIDALYDRGVEEIKKHVFNPDCITKILRPKLGDSAGVFGAAFL